MATKRGTTTSGKKKGAKDLPVKAKTGRKVRGGFEITDWSFGVENTTTIGSASSGAGSGKLKK